MIRYQCDKCGARMNANDARRYIVKVEIYAAAGHVDLTRREKESPESQMQDVLRELAEANPDEIEDQTYRAFRFDVCDACRKVLMSKPLA
jgi:hypothetical protein